MSFIYVDTPQALQQACDALSRQPVLAMDTEFVRERTYYPQLGLLQFFGGDKIYLVDPLAIEDLSPLAGILSDPNIVKVLHACGEDIEILEREFGAAPTPLMDSQIAATLLEIGNNPGYAKLVEAVLGIQVPKDVARSDWLQRPLADRQLEYAADDVLHLLEVYQELEQRLNQRQLTDICQQECQRYIDDRLRAAAPEDLYKDVKGSWQLNPRSLAVLRELAVWRLRKAQQQDRPLSFIAKDEALVEIARLCPDKPFLLRQISTLPPVVTRKYGTEIIQVVEQGLAVAQSDWPTPLIRLIDFNAYTSVSKQLRKEAQQIAADQQIPVEILISKRMINEFLSWLWKRSDEERQTARTPTLASGWRKPLFEAALDRVVQSCPDGRLK